MKDYKGQLVWLPLWVWNLFFIIYLLSADNFFNGVAAVMMLTVPVIQRRAFVKK